jgi:ankyrin repeat protein
MAQPRLIIALLLATAFSSEALAAQKAKAPAKPAVVVAPAADTLIVKRNYKAAFAVLLKQAQQGDAKAMVKVGHALRLGLGTEMNLAEARKWYELAAGANNSEAKSVLARLEIKVPSTLKKTADATGVPVPEGAIDFAHLPPRPEGQPSWFDIAAAHRDHLALKSLASVATGGAALISAKLGDAEALTVSAAPPAVDNLGRSSVMLALAQGKPEVLAASLASKPDLSITDKSGLTVTAQAAASCDADKLGQLVAAGAPLVGGTSPALVAAARACEDWSKLKELFTGADLNAADARGRSAAWYAAAKGNVALLGWLADKGANLSLQDKDGLAPLHSAALGKQALAFRFILNKTNNYQLKSARGVTPLMFSSYVGCVECVAAVLDLKPSLDEKDASGDTALMYAVRGLQGVAAQKLAESGANPNAKNAAADTPFKLGERLGLAPGK